MSHRRWKLKVKVLWHLTPDDVRLSTLVSFGRLPLEMNRPTSSRLDGVLEFGPAAETEKNGWGLSTFRWQTEKRFEVDILQCVVKIMFAWIFQVLYFRLYVIDKSYRQVLTPVNNSQLLLKLEILDKFRLVTFHTNKTQRNYNIITGSCKLRRNGSSHDLEPQSINITIACCLSMLAFSLRPDIHFAILP
jgi:hypothetical protein